MDVGTTINGRYRIQEEIGRGSFGIVFLAEDVQSGEQRALKLLLPWAEKDESLRHRLSREARLAGQLTSPHAVRIFDNGETEDGVVYTVMEYIRGKELSELLHEHGVLLPDRVTHIAEQILHALADAHKLGVIHRDLKPSNVLVTNDGAGDVVKVFDFGIAKVAGTGTLTESKQLTELGGVLGTPAYMSPEQCRGDQLTPASDLYSLGIVLYELLTGKPPFNDENPARVMMMQNSSPLPKLPDQIAKSPLGRAVLRALEKVPAARFANATEFPSAINPEVAAIHETSASEKAAKKSPGRFRRFFRKNS